VSNPQARHFWGGRVYISAQFLFACLTFYASSLGQRTFLPANFFSTNDLNMTWMTAEINLISECTCPLDRYDGTWETIDIFNFQSIILDIRHISL